MHFVVAQRHSLITQIAQRTIFSKSALIGTYNKGNIESEAGQITGD